MKKDVLLTVKSNQLIAKDVYKMVLTGDIDKHLPGQFVNVALTEKYLRRPISVCDYKENELTIVYKVVGSGTEILANKTANDSLQVLTTLGNGYDTSLMSKEMLLVGGGVGVPPMYYLAKELINQNHEVTVILGFNKKEEIFFEEEFKQLGAKVIVTTVDGSVGVKGFVTDAIKEYKLENLEYAACGPLPMLKALKKVSNNGHMSLEARMGCGFGACMGCSIETKNGYKRVCKEGPVFESEELLWED